jgi:hypothetical protein
MTVSPFRQVRRRVDQSCFRLEQLDGFDGHYHVRHHHILSLPVVFPKSKVVIGRVEWDHAFPSLRDSRNVAEGVRIPNLDRRSENSEGPT